MTDLPRRGVLGAAAAIAAALGLGGFAAAAPPAKTFPYRLTDAQWRAKLPAPAYRVLRQEGTEYPGSSPLNREHRAGVFHCAGCAQPLFSSKAKFDSGTGWPSFWEALPGRIGTSVDRSLMMVRVEEHCSNCGGHLGHIFDDGPRPTGKRHCINGVALAFRPATKV